MAGAFSIQVYNPQLNNFNCLHDDDFDESINVVRLDDYRDSDEDQEMEGYLHED